MQLVYLCDLISVEKDLDNNIEVSKRAPNFTLISKCALIDSYMMVLMRLFDTTESSNTKSIPNLIEKCLKCKHLFSNQTDVEKTLIDYKKRLENDPYISSAIPVLKLRRDSILAHNDKKFFGENIIKEHSILKKYQIWFLSNFTQEVLDYLHSQLTNEETTRKPKYNNDLNSLL